MIYILLLRHHWPMSPNLDRKQNVQEFDIPVCHTLVQSTKKNEENVQNSTAAELFSLALFDVPPLLFETNLSSWEKKVLVSFFPFYSSVALLQFPHSFQIKENLSFLAIHRLISCAKKIWNCKTHNNGLELRNFLTIISRSEKCVPPTHKLKFLCKRLFSLDTLCSFVFKALSSSSLVRLSRLLNGCGVLQPLLLFLSYIYYACCLLSIPHFLSERSESRTTVFYSVWAMGHLLVIARVLTLSFVVFGRISG